MASCDPSWLLHTHVSGDPGFVTHNASVSFVIDRCFRFCQTPVLHLVVLSVFPGDACLVLSFWSLLVILFIFCFSINRSAYPLFDHSGFFDLNRSQFLICKHLNFRYAIIPGWVI
jgi:hypothetical protein